jgi:hypothetical protein
MESAMHSTRRSFELWAAAHRVAFDGERSLSAKLTAGVAVPEDEVKRVVEHRATASHLLRAMLLDMEVHARYLRVATGPGFRASKPDAASAAGES